MPLTFADTVTPEQVRWLWPGYIPFGKVTVLDGDPGLGKSTILIDIAARLSVGAALPNGKQHPPMGTILLMGEDGAGDTIVPRLINAGADLAKVGIRDTYTNDKGNEIPPSFPADLDKLTEDMQRANAGLVVIDPIMSYLDPDINSNNDQQVRRALMPLAQLADDSGCAIVLLRHLNKSTQSSALYRGGGSIGFVGVARSGLIVARDPDATERVVLASTKSNLGPPPPSLNYKLVGCENGAARVEWEGKSNHTATTLVTQAYTNDGERGAVDEAVSFLKEALANGLRLAKEVQKEARDAGIADRTLRRAREVLGITMESGWVRKARTQDGQYVWEMPHKDEVGQEKVANSEPLDNLDNLDNIGQHQIDSDLVQGGPKMSNVVHAQNMATIDARGIPLSFSAGGGYECAVCNTPIRWIAAGKPLLCAVHREWLIVQSLTAD